MTKVHTSPNGFEIHNLKNVLEAQGIACEIRGEFRKGAAGELPINECWVELWIDDAAEEKARRILAKGPGSVEKSWTCSRCNETVEGSFDQCWNCQADR